MGALNATLLYAGFNSNGVAVFYDNVLLLAAFSRKAL